MIAFNKCGGTSIINTFKTEPDQIVARGTGTLSFKDSRTPEVNVAFFRHPLNRVASVYNHLIVEVFREKFRVLGFFEDMFFIEFVETLLTIDINADEHLKPQMTSFNELRDKHSATWTGRLENIHVTWPMLVDVYSMGCSTRLPKFNAKEYKPLWVGDKLTTSLIELYADDYFMWHELTIEARTTIPPVGHEVP